MEPERFTRLTLPDKSLRMLHCRAVICEAQPLDMRVSRYTGFTEVGRWRWLGEDGRAGRGGWCQCRG